MPRRPDGSFVVSELVDHVEDGATIYPHCKNWPCNHDPNTPLDLGALIAKYGPHTRFSDLKPRFRCTKCGALGRAGFIQTKDGRPRVARSAEGRS